MLVTTHYEFIKEKDKSSSQVVKEHDKHYVLITAAYHKNRIHMKKTGTHYIQIPNHKYCNPASQTLHCQLENRSVPLIFSFKLILIG